VTPAVAALHQFVATLEPGAIGAHVLEVQRLMHERGVESEVFAEVVRHSMEGRAHHFSDYGRGRGARDRATLLYHTSIGSVVADFVRDRPEPLVVDHHNVTPLSFLGPWEPSLVQPIRRAIEQVRELGPRSALGIAHSRMSETDLLGAGYQSTAVVPILVNLDDFQSEADPDTLGELQAAKAGGGADLLFVGRVAPNKCQHDLVAAFALYRQVYDPAARLHIVGGSSSDTYLRALHSFVEALGLTDAVSFTGSVPQEVLVAHYRAADAFVCLSEHEGFCVPLLEAMHHGVPVVAFAAAAVPETLGDAGVLLASKAAATVAAAIHRVLADDDLRTRLVAAGHTRLTDFALDRTRARFVEVIEAAVGS
jgi:glycosyltransferase involved in cell wall biosynthesis